MRRLGRKGRILKWAGLGLSLLIFAAWLAGVLYILRFRTSCIDCGLWRGALWVFPSGAPPTNKAFFSVPRLSAFDAMLWWFPSTLPPRTVFIPLWIPFLLTTVPTVTLWWRDRHIPPGHCQRCGYDLTGNVSGVCSECGTPLPENRPGR